MEIDAMESASPGRELPGVGPGATLLFVHAHPDDETIVTGATLARYAAVGARVAVLTCTRGELGEVIPEELAHLEVKQARQAATEGNTAAEGNTADGAGLAAVREAELAAALAALGVHEHYWLGSGAAGPGPGSPDVPYRDSGMQWGADGRATAAPTVLPNSLSLAPLDEVAHLAARLLRTLRPDAVVTYAADGGYGHPDHVRTHQLTMRALELAEDDDGGQAGWCVPQAFAIVSDRPERPLDPGVERLAVTGDAGAKRRALEAHRTQVVVAGDRFALSNGVWNDISGTEEFQRLPWPR